MGYPPGLIFLASRLPYILTPPCVVYVLSLLAKSYLGTPVPVWALVPAYLLSWPLLAAAYIQWQGFTDARDAAANGAVLAPVVASDVPGGFDLIKQISNDFEHHFLGYRFAEWTKLYGHTYNWRATFEDRLFTDEPEYIKRILATDFQGYAKGPRFHFQMKSLLGTGVFNADGEMWKFHRGMTRPFFSKDRIAHFDVFDRHAEAALNLMKTRMEEGFPVDWQDLVSRFTLDSATEFLFGQDVHSLSAPLPYPPNTLEAQAAATTSHPANRFASAFLEAQIASAKRNRYNAAWPMWEFLKDEVEGPVQVMDEFIRPILTEALAQKAKNPEAKSAEVAEGETLLEHLVNLTDDPQIIRDETVNILLAGRDTTALTLTMAVYMLAEHPNVLKRLQEEILTTVGTRRPTIEDIREMKYLRAFINEVLRLYPAVPFNVRYANGPAIWPAPTSGAKPFYIPARTRCTYSVFFMHRRKDLWGPDAHEFDPDRFLDDRVAKYLTPNPFIFLPFNAGPRICLGQQFAYNESSFMLIRLLQHVSDIQLRQDAVPEAVPPPGWADSACSNGRDRVRIKSHLTMFVDGGLWVTMKPAEPVV